MCSLTQAVGVCGLLVMVSLESSLVEASGFQVCEESLESGELLDFLSAEGGHRKVAEHRGDAADVYQAGIILVSHPHYGRSGGGGAIVFGKLPISIIFDNIAKLLFNTLA